GVARWNHTDARPAAAPISAATRAKWAFLTGDWTPESDEERRQPLFIDRGILGNGGLFYALEFMEPIRDPSSLDELREATESRGPRALAARKAELEQLASPKDHPLAAIRLFYELGMLSTYDGRFDEAASWFEKALALCPFSDAPPRVRTNLIALL